MDHHPIVMITCTSTGLKRNTQKKHNPAGEARTNERRDAQQIARSVSGNTWHMGTMALAMRAAALSPQRQTAQWLRATRAPSVWLSLVRTAGARIPTIVKNLGYTIHHMLDPLYACICMIDLMSSFGFKTHMRSISNCCVDYISI